MNAGRVTLTIPQTPPSANKWLSSHWRVRYREKAEWENMLTVELRKWGMPKCDRVEASLYIRFSDRRKRDTDNHVATLSKCLGDALRPDFIPDDDSSRFQVIHGQISSEVGPKETIVILDWFRGAVEPEELVA